jgi:hypothetical protein
MHQAQMRHDGMKLQARPLNWNMQKATLLKAVVGYVVMTYVTQRPA